MKFILNALPLLSTILLPLTAALPVAAERVALINDAAQLSTNTGVNIGTALTDDNGTTSWQTPDGVGTSDAGNPQGLHYIQVKLNESLTLADDEDIIVYMQRTNSKTMQPTAMEIMVSSDGVAWETFVDVLTAKTYQKDPSLDNPSTHVYFTYRGPNTKEYSTRIHTTKTFQYLRFIVKANNSKTLVSGSDMIRRMELAEFQIIKLGRSDTYSENQIDRFRLISDYYHDGTPHTGENGKAYYEYEDFTFENTQGIFDERLRGTKDLPEDWLDDWEACWDADGIWKKDKLKLHNAGIEMPKYSFITHEEDPLIEPGQKRQRTHVIEHELLAIPGDAIALYPYFTLYDESYPHKYEENFVHWYDYRTGGNLIDPYSGKRMLDFLIDPSKIFFNNDHGYFGGVGARNPMNEVSYGIPRLAKEGDSDEIKIGSVEEYLNFVSEANNGYSPIKRNVILTADLDFAGVEYNDPKSIVLGSSDSTPFMGVFDGHGHTIKNLKINCPQSPAIGFIGYLAGTLQNITFDSSCEFTGSYEVGIVGEAYSSQWDANKQADSYITNVVSYATVIATNKSDDIREWPAIWGSRVAGGILGGQSTIITADSYKAVTISNCATIGSVISQYKPQWETVKYYPAGQLVGYAQNMNINNCWSTATLQCMVEDPESQNPYAPEYILSDDPSPNFYIKPEYGKIKINNCYSSYGANELNTVSPENWEDIPVGEPITYLGSTWIMGETGPVNEYAPVDSGLRPSTAPQDIDKGNINGAYATFFFPRSPYRANGIHASLPFVDKDGNVLKVKNADGTESDADEYTIAADFSVSFDYTKSIDYNTKTILEPELVYRHIFHIKDGRKFAEDFSGSVAKNREYTTKHRRVITARAGVDFQVRLDAPIPTDPKNGARSRYYYKISETDYRRICGVGFEIYDISAGTDQPQCILKYRDGNQTQIESWTEYAQYFSLGKGFKGQGKREIDGITYYACGGFGAEQVNYNRFLCIGQGGAVANKKYLVRLLARDVNGDYISPADPTDIDGTQNNDYRLVYREFIIEFVDTKKAFYATEATMEEDIYKNGENSGYWVGQEEVLDNKCGAPISKIDFDEYMVLTGNSTTGQQPNMDYLYHRSENCSGSQIYDGYYGLRWPLPRTMCNYGFTYGKIHNYNLYRVSQHSSQTDWNANVSGHTNEGYDDGLFDRHFYDLLTAYKKDQAKPEAERKGLQAPKTPDDCGFFYYINAASDPGVSARLNVGKLCNGANLFISAWVAEFSNSSEKANVSFNLVAVTKDDTRTKVHSFITGPTVGGQDSYWYKVYYDFTPDFSLLGIDPADIDHYEIELDNNCASSEGADYAIDDIRIYMIGADVKAEQLNFPCDDKDKVVEMKVYTPYRNLLSLSALDPAEDSAAGSDFDVYYTILDRAIYDNEIANDAKDLQSAYNKAVIKGCYGIDGTPTDSDATYGKITANTFYGNMPEYTESLYTAMRYNAEGYDVDYLAFNCKVQSDQLRVGKDYIIAVFTDGLVHDDGWAPEAADFKLGDECSSRCIVAIQGSKKIKIDGVMSSEDATRECCENQTPMVQIDIQGYLQDSDGNKIGDQIDAMKNACFDWYQGPSGDFYSETDETGALYLWEVLAIFRNEYPSAVTADMPLTADYTEAMRKYLYEVTTGVDGKRPLLLLHQRSYIFPPAVLPEDMDEYTMYVTAIPCDNQFNTEDYIICNSPVEVPMHVHRHAPAMKNGLAIEYPEYMDDVPVRIGLKQLRAASADVDYDKVNVKDIEYNGVTLDCPIRYVDSTIEGVEGMTIFNTTEVVNGTENTVYDRSVYLSETNDPEYLKSEALSAGMHVDGEDDEEGMLRIGYVATLDAETLDDPSAQSKNMACMVFDKKFNFKEGYYYRMKFRYSEIPLEDPDYIPPCMGEQVVTLKVVPEYMMWTAGGESLNWNNDNSWRRVSAEEMYAKTAEEKENLKDHLIDGVDAEGAAVNPNILSYSPAPFTKVILPVTASVPGTLDVPVTVAVSRGNGSPSSDETAAPEPASIENPYLYHPAAEADLSFFTAGGNRTMPWTSDPNDADSGSPAGVPENKIDLWASASTFDIQYDMVAFDGTTGEAKELSFVGCGPWQAHICDQIDFMPGAGISNQQHLHYNKAWVEIEMDPDRWYTLSSPLKATFAGDMYMPTDNSRQESLRFEDILYDPKLNHRFKPAVYQRSWNKATANLYELPSADLGTGENVYVAVANDWGHVYNDVLERYVTGAGFSIMSDISGVTNKTDGHKVLMRLPKADTEWYYYDVEWTGPDNNTTTDGIHGNHTEVPARPDNYRLNETSGKLKATGARSGTESNLFLVGNPFMTDLDMEKLLEKNSDKIEPKYWILSDNSCQAAVMGQHVYTNGIEAGAKVSPLQGFFVQAKDAASELELAYDESMMLRADKGGSLLRKPGSTRAAAAAMTLTMMSDTLEISHAVLAIDPEADSEYGAEDAALLLDPLFVKSAQVYTVAGNTAAVVNVTNDAEGLEIGVYDNSKEDTDVESSKFIRFSDTDTFADYMLLDVATGESRPVEEGMTLPVEGNVSGRYFLTRGSDMKDEIRSIRVSRDGNEVTVSTGRGTLSVEVFDALGRHVGSHAAGSPEATDGARVSFPLPSGVYLLRVSDGVERRTPKLIIK